MLSKLFETVRSSIVDTNCDVQSLVKAIYGEIFRKEPNLREFFKSDMSDQIDHFSRALSFVLSSEPSVKSKSALKELGDRHIGYGVTEHHYELAREAVLTVLTEHLGQKFTPTIRSAWDDVLQFLFGSMRD